MKYQPSPASTLADRLGARSELQPNGCILWLGDKDKDGYGRMRWAGKRHRVHRLVLALKLGRDLLPDAQACHSCDTPSCINADHLREGTHVDNVKDRSERNRVLRGERNPACRLTDAQVAKIRQVYGRKEATQVELAARYGVAQTTISAIVRGVIRC